MAKIQAKRRVPPPVLFVAAWGVQRLMTRRKVPTAASRTAFTVLTVASGVLALSAVGSLFVADTQIGPEHPEKSTTLLTGGPFRFTRNPVYLALAGILAARALLYRSAAAFVPAAGFVAVLNRKQVPAEERALHAHFGRKYDRYRRSTPRWLGRVRQ